MPGWWNLADTLALGANGLNSHAGSMPVPGTKFAVVVKLEKALPSDGRDFGGSSPPDRTNFIQHFHLFVSHEQDAGLVEFGRHTRLKSGRLTAMGVRCPRPAPFLAQKNEPPKNWGSVLTCW